MTSMIAATTPQLRNFEWEKIGYRDVCIPVRAKLADSIIAQLEKQGTCNKFLHILKLSGIFHVLDDSQADFTVFAVRDINIGDISQYECDIGKAMVFAKSHILKRRITLDLLKSSEISYFTTLNSQNRLYATHINRNLLLNDYIRIVTGDIQASNGLIHLVDRPLNPYTF